MAAPRTRALLLSSALAPGIVMLASFTPTPLFPEYQALWGIGETGVSVIFAAYPLGVVTSLILLGGLSDVVGRRRSILLGGTVLLFALGILAGAVSPLMMVVGRYLQGVGVALLSTATASALMELHPRGPAAGSQFNTASISIGVAVGPLLSGLLADSMPAPLVTPYLVVAALVLIPLTLAAISPTTLTRPGGRLVQTIKVPRALWRPFAACAAATAITNVCTGLLGAFGPEVAASIGWQGSALSGFFVSVVLGSIAVAQLVGGRLAPHITMMGGGIIAAGGWALLALGSNLTSVPIALAGAIVLGLGAGATLLGSAASLAGWAPPHRRAELYAAWLLVPFTTLGVSAFLAAPLLASTSLLTVLLSACCVTVLATALVTLTVARPRQTPTGEFA